MNQGGQNIRTSTATSKKSTVALKTGLPDFGPVLRVEDVSKRFSGTLALDTANLAVFAGEVHVLIGENGAGKSTLSEIIAGVHRQDSGNIYLNDELISIRSISHARSLGISMVFQDFSLIPQLSVEENLFLGSEQIFGPFLNKAELRSQAKSTLEWLGFEINLDEKVVYLSRAEQQMVEIAKAFRTKPSVLLLDEPTAALTEREAARLFSTIQMLKSEGIAIVYITHRMNEIRAIGDRITVLRDGQHVKTLPVAGATDDDLVRLLTGRKVEQIFPCIQSHQGRTMLQIENLTLKGGGVVGASLDVRAGEIVGIAGLVGSGKSKFARSAFGLETIRSGRITFNDEVVFDVSMRNRRIKPRLMLDRGVYYLPSDRRQEGLVMVQSLRENVTLPSLGLAKFANGFFLRRNNEKAFVQSMTGELEMRPYDIEVQLQHFSGGNQQKAMVAKGLLREGRLFILDEPTNGVDISTRIRIYQFIKEICERGAGVLLVSSDLSEILHLTHRTFVMHNGRITAEFKGDEVTEENLLRNFFEQKAKRDVDSE